jgi:uncharacterized protein YkwD
MKSNGRHRRARPVRSAWSDRLDRPADPRAGRRRRARGAAVSAVVALAIGGAAFLGAALATGHLGGGIPAAMIAGEPASSTAQPVRDSWIAVTDHGIVKGTLRVVTPVTGGDVRVTYVVEGPRTVVQVADSAPYELVLDTRTLPNGTYTVKQVVFRGDLAPSMTTSHIFVRNPGSGVRTATAGPPSFPGGTGPAAAGSTAGPAGGASATSANPVARPSVGPASLAPIDPAAAGPNAAASVDAIRVMVVKLTNTQRAKVGCRALTVDGRLGDAAQEHSAEMAAHNYFGHTSLDGSTAFERITDAGYAYSAAAENIAAGQRTAAAVMTAWMNSPGHRANILNCSLTQIGVGYATGGGYGFYWTQDFGTP